MLSRTSLLFILLLWAFAGNAQLTTSPALPVASKAVVLTFNSAEESRLGYYTTDLYAHTGVITDKSTDNDDWKYVIGNWGNNTVQPKLTNKGNGIYELTISPDIYTFYSIPSSEKVLKMAFVFRSSDGSKQTNNLYVTVYEEGLIVEITEPSGNPIFEKNTAVTLTAATSTEAALKLSLNGTLLTETTGTSISTQYTFTNGGTYELIAEASVGNETVYDTASIFVRDDVVTETKPAAYRKGINYVDDNTVALVLYAPLKEYVFVIGDFTDWKVNTDFQMKKDGDFFWLVIPNLKKNKEYIFQYFIDGELKIADPYSEKILDPWDDKYIPETSYPDLIAYPEGKTDGIATVIQTAQQPYNWQVTDFEAPEKDKLVIYELLVRDFTTEQNYQAVIEKLDYLEDLRINVLELMPVNEFEGNNSWGYNPSFYFAPDKFYGTKNKLKQLIDECHKRGIAVVIDMVLNHSYGQSPLVQMYMDNWTVTADNPWYNTSSPNSTYSWGYDFNHESQATQELVDSVNSFWISEYKVDGFRFDFTKGFTQKTGDGWAYDASRIAILKRMADQIWARDPDNLIILEHLTDNSEEKELANYGLMLWGNMHNGYLQAAKGNVAGSNLNDALYTQRGWNVPNLVSYPESHDEERLMYDLKLSGIANGDYDVKDEKTALKRIALNSVFHLPLPGPKMIWQFGERGYDLSINRCEDGSINNNCRTYPKPPLWDYLGNTDRTDLFDVMAKLNELKQTYEEFTPDNFTYDLAGAVKWFILNSGENKVLAVGNFDIQVSTPTISFPKTGKWYEFFKGDSTEVTNQNRTLILQPGEYRLYSTRKFAEPHITTDVGDIQSSKYQLNVYPNPVQNTLFVSAEKWIDQVEIYSLTGKLMTRNTDRSKEKQLNVEDFSPGIYLLRVILDGEPVSRKIVVQ
ncbi:T9SS type A sorting domain-containing protein [Maribellus sp. CM-23]|uniref:alpha-amylase family glycosyl hydrolase n=1 Tax=Maribellus sp. CM-23 TaxID=2781026 RepID=UPI001F15C15A|nr:alpha-amylase family glycosyl hydrolase [Maribellus sp. CM-23]MCE4566777.1 T9SS type A sorting domain-containing protein [Maribellus sp. CM-23]